VVAACGGGLWWRPVLAGAGRREWLRWLPWLLRRWDGCWVAGMVAEVWLAWLLGRQLV